MWCPVSHSVALSPISLLPPPFHPFLPPSRSPPSGVCRHQTAPSIPARPASQSRPTHRPPRQAACPRWRPPCGPFAVALRRDGRGGGGGGDGGGGQDHAEGSAPRTPTHPTSPRRRLRHVQSHTTVCRCSSTVRTDDHPVRVRVDGGGPLQPHARPDPPPYRMRRWRPQRERHRETGQLRACPLRASAAGPLHRHGQLLVRLPAPTESPPAPPRRRPPPSCWRPAAQQRGGSAPRSRQPPPPDIVSQSLRAAPPAATQQPPAVHPPLSPRRPSPPTLPAVSARGQPRDRLGGAAVPVALVRRRRRQLRQRRRGITTCREVILPPPLTCPPRRRHPNNPPARPREPRRSSSACRSPSRRGGRPQAARR